MSYNTKYQINFHSQRGVNGAVYLKKDGYAGGITELKMSPGGLKIDYKFEDWFEPVIGQSCTLNILNDLADYYDLDDLMTLDEREFQIVVDASDADGTSINLFNGWINSDTVEQRYFTKSFFKLTGSNYLSKLTGSIHPEILDSSTRSYDRQALMNYINEGFQLTGKDTSIYVNCTLEPSTLSTMGTDQTLFNRAAIYPEVFWKDNVDRVPGLEMIEKILRPFDCYTYVWDNKWYIERYADARKDDGQKEYVIYNNDDTSVGFGDTFNTDIVSEPSTNMDELTYTNFSQNRSSIPGLKLLSIDLKQDYYDNLTINEFYNPAMRNVGAGVNNWAGQRRWDSMEGTISSGGGPEGLATVHNAGLFSPYQQITRPVVMLLYPNVYYDYDVNAGNNDSLKDWGIATVFECTITDPADTSLGTTSISLSWKWGCQTTAQAWDWTNENLVEYKLHWWLNVGGITNDYIMYDEGTSEWYVDYSGTRANCVQTITVTPDDLDQTTGVYEAQVQIPLSDVSDGYYGDTSFQFAIGHPTAEWNNGDIYFGQASYVGDVGIAVSGDLQENRYDYDVSMSNTLNEKKVELDIFDSTNLGLKNGLFTSYSWQDKTELWTDIDQLEYYDLAQWLAKTKLALYNRNRKKITSEAKYGSFLKPFSIWYDTGDPSIRPYILTKYSYTPDQDEYNLEWWEYDNETQIDLE